MAAKRTKYLTYIEETRKYHSLLNEVAQDSSRKARQKSHASSVPVTYLNGNIIVKETNEGDLETIAEIKISRRTVEVGAKTKLSKK